MGRGKNQRRYRVEIEGGEWAAPIPPGPDESLANHRAWVAAFRLLYPNRAARLWTIPPDSRVEPKEILAVATWTRG